MTELSNEDDLNITPKLIENKNNRFGKSPINMPTLSKVIKRKVNNNLMKKSQKIKKEKDQLFLDYHRNSINNMNNYRTNLPNIITSFTPIEKQNNYKRISVATKNKSSQGNNKSSYISRNFDLSMLNYHNSDNINFFQNDQLNNTFNLKRVKKGYNNNYKYNENDNEMNLSQILSNKNKNNIYMGSNNLYSRNIDNKSNQNLNYMTQNNMNSSTKNNFNNKMKFTLNKKNLMNTIKKPSKINLEKKNLKYKIPLDMINNYNYGKKKLMNDIMEGGGQGYGNNRKLNIKQRNNKSTNKDIIDCSNIDIENNEKEEVNINKSKDFIKSTIIAFNGLVSQAQELGQILIDNKEMMNTNNKNELNSSKLINSIDNINDMDINNINVKSKLNKLNQEINNEHKTVEELQKINSDLNNKINLFNENTQQYENKVKELVTVINQIKNTNNNNASNSNSNSDNFSNGVGNNNVLGKDSVNNFILENKPKKKKLKFGFVETIFMKDDKFQIILKKKPPQYDISNKEYLTINKTLPKLLFVNMNKDNNENNGKGKNKASEEEYLDAASQMANHIIIESLISMENEDEDKL